MSRLTSISPELYSKIYKFVFSNVFCELKKKTLQVFNQMEEHTYKYTLRTFKNGPFHYKLTKQVKQYNNWAYFRSSKGIWSIKRRSEKFRIRMEGYYGVKESLRKNMATWNYKLYWHLNSSKNFKLHLTPARTKGFRPSDSSKDHISPHNVDK